MTNPNELRGVSIARCRSAARRGRRGPTLGPSRGRGPGATLLRPTKVEPTSCRDFAELTQSESRNDSGRREPACSFDRVSGDHRDKWRGQDSLRYERRVSQVDTMHSNSSGLPIRMPKRFRRIDPNAASRSERRTGLFDRLLRRRHFENERLLLTKRFSPLLGLGGPDDDLPSRGRQRAHHLVQ